MNERTSDLVRTAAIATFVAAILLGSFIPVYTDEIGWRFQERAGFDGLDKMFSEVCGPNTLAVPPFFMWPARWFSAAFNSAFANPAWIRFSGVLYALAIAALTVVVARRAAEDRPRGKVLAAIAAGLLALGIMPMLLIWSRPEQPILICALAAVALALARAPDERRSIPFGRAVFGTLMILALWVIAVSYHLKGLFLLPVFGACLFYVAGSRAGRLPAIAGAVAMLGVAASGASYWLGRLACPDSPILQQAFAYNSIGAEVGKVASLDDGLALIGRMIGNLTIAGYVALAAPNPYPLSYWLPARQVSEGDGMTIYLFLLLAWGAAILLSLAGAKGAIGYAIRTRAPDRRLVLAGAVFVTLLGWCVTQSWRNVYEAPFMFVLAAVFVVLLIGGGRFARRGERYVRGFAVAVAVLAVANIAAQAAIWAPALSRSWQQSGYLKDQPYSIALRGYPALREQIMATARLCRIPAPEKARGVLVDELTYFAYMDSRLPQHRLGVLSVWNGEIDDPIAYLRTRKSDGAILGCHLLKGDLRQRAKANGQFCCLGPADIGG